MTLAEGSSSSHLNDTGHRPIERLGRRIPVMESVSPTTSGRCDERKRVLKLERHDLEPNTSFLAWRRAAPDSRSSRTQQPPSQNGKNSTETSLPLRA